MDDNSPPVSGWDEWLDKWRSCRSAEKDRLLRLVFVVYRENADFEWWHVWFLMFIKELSGLSSYFRSRIPDPDERWSDIAWSFLNVVAYPENLPDAERSVVGVFCQVKRAINRKIQAQRKIRRFERLLPDLDFLPHCKNACLAWLEREQPFESLCSGMALFFNGLSALDKIIVEETYILGHPRENCAGRLGLSRHQVDRRLLRLKVKISRFLNLPIAK